jgi:nucleotide-binding universal stress UspA family protein
VARFLRFHRPEAKMKILIGYDGSPSAQDALQDLARAGLPRKARVRVISALNPWMPPDFFSTREPEMKAWYSAAYARALAEAEATEERARKLGGRAAAILRRFHPGWSIAVEPALGMPDHALLTKADAWKPDLVVMGTHGRSGMAGLLVGSVSQKVLHHARCAVRIGRPGPAGPREPIRLLLAMDGSSHAEAALKEILRREWPAGTQVRLVAVMDFHATLDDAMSGLRSAGKRTKSAKNAKNAARAASGGSWPWMRRILDKAAARLEKAGLSATTALIPGEPREVLPREARSYKAAALFMGSRGLSGFRRLLLGSVSSSLAAHAPCTVEIIRMKERNP